MPVNYTREPQPWTDGTGSTNPTVWAEDAERWEQLGTDVAAWSGAVPPADLRVGARQGVLALPANRYLRAYRALRVDDNGYTTQSRLTFVPVRLAVANTFSYAYTNVGTGASGAVVRFGLYAPHATTGRPDARVAEYGTVDAGTAGTKILTIPGTTTIDPGFYWLGGVIQGGGANVGRYVDTNTPGISYFGDAAHGSGGAQSFGYPYMNSVTGALPATATIDGYAEIAVLVALRTA